MTAHRCRACGVSNWPWHQVAVGSTPSACRAAPAAGCSVPPTPGVAALPRRPRWPRQPERRGRHPGPGSVSRARLCAPVQRRSPRRCHRSGCWPSLLLARLIRRARLYPAPPGPLGHEPDWRAPPSLGPWPHISAFHIIFARRFTYRGTSHSYLSASCPVPPRFTGGLLPFARASYFFTTGPTVTTTVARACHVR